MNGVDKKPPHLLALLCRSSEITNSKYFSHTSLPSVPRSHSAYFCLRAFAHHSLFAEALPPFFIWPILFILFRLHVVSSLSDRTIIPDMLCNTQLRGRHSQRLRFARQLMVTPFPAFPTSTTAHLHSNLHIYNHLFIKCSSSSLDHQGRDHDFPVHLGILSSEQCLYTEGTQ